MTIRDTKELMVSKDYKERFIAEYVQTVIRYYRLSDILEAAKSNTLPESFTPTCPLDILDMQRVAMAAYLEILKKRADLESIILPSVSIKEVNDK